MEKETGTVTQQPAGGKVYVREASGMVRELGPLATLAVSASIVAVGTAFNLMEVYQAVIYPGSIINVGLTLALVPATFFGIMYVLFSMNMPRSGGDYVYVSRIVHPAIGFMMNFAFTFWLIIWWGSDFPGIVEYMVSPALGGYALATNNSSLLSFASSIGTNQNWIFAGGVIALIITAIFVLLGTKYTARFLVLGFIIGMIGQVVVMLLFAFTSQSAFISAFNSHFAGAVSVNSIVKIAGSNGWSYVPLSFAASVAAIPYAFLWYLGYNMSAYVAGEVKKVKSSMFIAILGSLILGWASYIISAYLYGNVVPYQFQQAASYLYYNAPSAYPTPIFPGPYFFVGLLTNSPIVAMLPLIAQIFWAALLPVAIAMVVTRNMFSWSFDRVVPSFFSDLNPHTHSPVKSTVIVCLIGLIFAWLWAYTTYLTLEINFIWALSIAFIIPGLAAIVYPYVKKGTLYKNTPAERYKIGRLPLIVLCGIISVVFYTYIAYECYVTPAISGPVGVSVIALILGSFIAGPVIYYAAKFYHTRKDGIDISAAFKEIPPG